MSGAATAGLEAAALAIADLSGATWFGAREAAAGCSATDAFAAGAAAGLNLAFNLPNAKGASPNFDITG